MTGVQSSARPEEDLCKWRSKGESEKCSEGGGVKDWWLCSQEGLEAIWSVCYMAGCEWLCRDVVVGGRIMKGNVHTFLCLRSTTPLHCNTLLGLGLGLGDVAHPPCICRGCSPVGEAQRVTHIS